MCDQPRGVYDLSCLDCCTRLVMSAHPDRPLARALMASIERNKGEPTKAAVVQSVVTAVQQLGNANATEKQRRINPDPGNGNA